MRWQYNRQFLLVFYTLGLTKIARTDGLFSVRLTICRAYKHAETGVCPWFSRTIHVLYHCKMDFLVSVSRRVSSVKRMRGECETAKVIRTRAVIHDCSPSRRQVEQPGAAIPAIGPPGVCLHLPCRRWRISNAMQDWVGHSQPIRLTLIYHNFCDLEWSKVLPSIQIHSCMGLLRNYHRNINPNDGSYTASGTGRRTPETEYRSRRIRPEVHGEHRWTCEILKARSSFDTHMTPRRSLPRIQVRWLR